MASAEPEFDLVARLETPEHPDWAVWSDALQARGDPRGRLIALERLALETGAEPGAEQRALQAELEEELHAALRACEPGGWLGVRRSSWRLGYLRELSLAFPLPGVADLRPLFACPALRGLASLELELRPETASGLVEALADHPSSLRALALVGQDFVTLEGAALCRELFDALPRLRRLELDALALDALDHAALVELDLRADATVHALGADAGLPKLERLGAELHASALAALLDRARLPGLRVLDLMNGDMRRFDGVHALDELTQALARGMSLEQLDELAVPHLWGLPEPRLRAVAPELGRAGKIVTTAPGRGRRVPLLHALLPGLEYREPPAAALRRLRGVLRLSWAAADSPERTNAVFVPTEQLAAYVGAAWAELALEQRTLARRLLGLASGLTLELGPLRALLAHGELQQPVLADLRARLDAAGSRARPQRVKVELM